MDCEAGILVYNFVRMMNSEEITEEKSMKKLWLLRHGQTMFNRKDMVQGQCDSPLSDLGIEQAKAAGAYIKEMDIHPDHIYTSDLPRTRQTLEQFYDGPSTPVRGLRERSYGILEGESNTMLGYAFEDPEMLVKCRLEDNDHLIPRVTNTLKEIMDQPENQEVLCVVHGDMMMNFARSIDPEEMEKLERMRNCIIFEFDYDENTRTFSNVRIHQEFLDKAGL